MEPSEEGEEAKPLQFHEMDLDERILKVRPASHQ
jgi:hypothetical protein